MAVAKSIGIYELSSAVGVGIRRHWLMNSALTEFLNELFNSLNTGNFENISELLSIEEDSYKDSLTTESTKKRSITNRMRLIQEISSMKDKTLKDTINSNWESEEIWPSLVLSHLKVLKILNSKAAGLSKFFEATTEQINAMNSFLRIFSSSSHLPILYKLTSDCWKLALFSGSSEAQEQAARVINRSFIACITERSSFSRKWGTYRIAGLLLRVYFHLGQLNLVQNVIKALNACELPAIDDFPRAHTVTFNYFLGRYYFSREEFDASEKCFIFCFERLATFPSQLNSVLHFLIPIKLILNLQKPQENLISLFESHQNRLFYQNLVEIISAGDLDAFKLLLQENHQTLLKFGSFTLYEKLFLIILRQKIKRIYKLTENSTRISLILLKNLCKTEELEDVNCLVANLIAKGLIRGYISEEKQFLVLSAQNPFPNTGYAL